jgi:rubrerythrin
MTAAESRVIARMRRRLAAMELEHLRAHALELHERAEKAESALERAEDAAQFWHDQAMRMEEAAADPDFATHRSIGITKDGAMVVVRVAS